jgi:hypothetical protein
MGFLDFIETAIAEQQMLSFCRVVVVKIKMPRLLNQSCPQSVAHPLGLPPRKNVIRRLG